MPLQLITLTGKHFKIKYFEREMYQSNIFFGNCILEVTKYIGNG